MSDALSFTILGIHIRVDVDDPQLRQIVLAMWGQMCATGSVADLTYIVVRGKNGAILVETPADSVIRCATTGEFVFQLEQLVILELQHRRTDLVFLHAAAVVIRDRACLLVAPSGQGKTTTAWGLIHQGCQYLSDELAPIDMIRMEVQPYQRGVAFKGAGPPAPYAISPQSVHTTHTIHSPVGTLPHIAEPISFPLLAMIFVSYACDGKEPVVTRIGVGEASARLYANMLNHLVHPNAGLEAAARISEAIPSWSLTSTDLSATSNLVYELLDELSTDVSVARFGAE